MSQEHADHVAKHLNNLSPQQRAQVTSSDNTFFNWMGGLFTGVLSASLYGAIKSALRCGGHI